MAFSDFLRPNESIPEQEEQTSAFTERKELAQEMLEHHGKDVVETVQQLNDAQKQLGELAEEVDPQMKSDAYIEQHAQNPLDRIQTTVKGFFDGAVGGKMKETLKGFGIDVKQIVDFIVGYIIAIVEKLPFDIDWIREAILNKEIDSVMNLDAESGVRRQFESDPNVYKNRWVDAYTMWSQNGKEDGKRPSLFAIVNADAQRFPQSREGEKNAMSESTNEALFGVPGLSQGIEVKQWTTILYGTRQVEVSQGGIKVGEQSFTFRLFDDSIITKLFLQAVSPTDPAAIAMRFNDRDLEVELGAIVNAIDSHRSDRQIHIKEGLTLELTSQV